MSEPTRILTVDDQPENLELLAAILEEEGYRIAAARDGIEALAEVERQLPHAILLDLMMPRMDGLEVCRRLKAARPTCFVPIILLTALSDVESKVRGLDAGADDFLNKPFQRAELLTRLRSLLLIRGLRDELDSTENVIFSMVELLEGKDPRTRHHSLRVAAIAAAAAGRLALSPRERESIALGALLHDLGKLGVPEAVLLRNGDERSAEELALYRRHPDLGRRILAPIESLAAVAEIVERHHESLDGSGHAGALRGDQIPLAVEIVALANRLDHLTGGHPQDAVAHRAELLRAAAAGRCRRETVEATLAAATAIPDDPRLDDVLPLPAPAPGGTILVADASASNRHLYRELLTGGGFDVLAAADGVEALAMLDLHCPDLMLLDLRTPEIAGDEVCRRVKSDPAAAFVPVILVTACEEREARRRALAAGADDLLLAPVHRTELLARVRSLLRLHLFHADLVGHESVVRSLSAALEAKDAYTRGHSARVGDLSARLAGELGENAETRERLHLGGVLHDIGKIVVPEALLHKPGKLTAEELATVMKHPVAGWEICRRLRSAQPVLDVIRYHHERFNGSGYPEGLAGERIPWLTRILSLADALDALTSERSYRRKLRVDEAISLLVEETASGKWDPRVTRGLVALHQRGGADPRRAAGDGEPE
jgi:putative two-component system response regulator